MKKILLFASAVAVLFSSCSTDNTSDVIGNEAKNGTITATAAYQQDETRTYLDESGEVFWSKGDAIGVLNETGTHVQFGLVSGEGTAEGSFDGNKNFLAKGAPVYAYYPFTKGTTFADETKAIELEIMSEQTFLDVATFDAAQAPGVAYVKSVEDLDNIALNFKGVASYVKFPIKGVGTLKSLTLSMDGQTLAGTGSVDFAKWPTTEEIAAAKEDEDAYAALALDIPQGLSEIKVNLGALELRPYDAHEILFVIPAGTTISGEISLTAEFADGSKQILKKDALNKEVNINRNEGRRIKANNQADWTFGLEGKYVIDSDAEATNDYDGKLTAEERFLAYAYLTRPGQASTTDYSDYVYAAAALDLDAAEDIATIEALVFADEVNFAGLDKEWANTQAAAAHAAEYKATTDADKATHLFWQGAYEWYAANNGAIESLSYNAVVGAPTSGAAQATIKNITVKGDGISAGASLENLVFEAVTVKAKDTDFAGLIAAHTNLTSQPYGAETAAPMVVKNVSISADNVVDATNVRMVGGIYGVYNKQDANMLPGAAAIQITNPGTEYTGRLFGDVTVGVYVDLSAGNYAWHESVAEYPVIGYFDANATVVAEGAIDATMAAMKNAGVVGKVVNKDNKVGSVIVNEVSYWNGGVKVDAAGDYYVAEELAYAIAEGKANTEVVLTNDIDMQCSINFTAVAPITDDEVAGIEAPAEQYVDLNSYKVGTTFNVTSDGEENNFEIKNVVAVSNQSRAALFGTKANISNVTLSNVSIYVAKSEAASGKIQTLAGIAGSGTAKDVTINGLTINIASDAVIAASSIGGVFATATPEAIENVTVSALAINYAGEEALDVRAGVIAGTLNVEPTTTPVVLKGIKLTGEANDYAVNNIGELYKQSTKIAAFVNTKNYAGAYPFGTISVDNAAFPANSRGKAYVGVDKAFETWSTAGAGMGNRLAAGVVFSDELTDAANSTVVVGATDTEYDYSFEFTGDVRVGNVNKTNFFGFTKK